VSRAAGKVVVTGAGEGQGAAKARLLAAGGATVAATPLGRTGTVDEMAPRVLFLMCDESSFIVGARIPIGGGMTAHGGVKSISDAVRAAS